MTSERNHNYAFYADGCRCCICRQAKADYMRERRAAARAKAKTHQAETGRPRRLQEISHGQAGYQEYGCRCTTCRGAMSAAARRRRIQAAQQYWREMAA
jgi:hypothetical protein